METMNYLDEKFLMRGHFNRIRFRRIRVDNKDKREK